MVNNHWGESALLHDVIKITYVREGYLPNYPPHLLSDEEMCEAFLSYPKNSKLTDDQLWSQFKSQTKVTWFQDRYPLIDPSLESEYRDLVMSIRYYIDAFLDSNDDARALPDWVYSYMLGTAISDSSDIEDIHDFLVLMDTDNINDDYDLRSAQACLGFSRRWLARLPESEREHRVPTMFGEPHVVKCVRVLASPTMYGGDL